LYEYCLATSTDDCTNWTNVGKSTSVSLSNLSQNTTYYWQVRAVNTFGTTYANSSTFWTFTTGAIPSAFNKSFPSNGRTGESLNPTLYWSISNGVAFYEYCIATSTADCTNWTSTGKNAYVPVSGLSQNTTYYWQVRAVNSFGTTYANGEPTVFSSFTTGTVPGAFNKTWPSNGRTGQPINPTLYWGTSSGATSYEYCIATSTVGCTNWTSTGTNKLVTLSDLNQNTTYYWQVRAINSFGISYANDSETMYWSFTTVP
jgi:hypothetical protein